MRKALMAAAAVFIGLASAGAANAVTYATTVVDFSPGTGVHTPDGADETNATGSPDGRFVSLGNGGSITLSFGKAFRGPGAIFEVTNGCTGTRNGGDGGVCSNWQEQVEVFVSNSADTDFISQGIVKNGGAGNPKSTSLAITGGPFTFVRLVDRTAELPRIGSDTVANDRRFASNAGFDVDAVSVTAIPLPAAAWLLLGGLGAMGLVARKRKAA